MLLIQYGKARRFRKVSIALAIILALPEVFSTLLTLHCCVAPPKK
jgi:hypothetical protein